MGKKPVVLNSGWLASNPNTLQNTASCSTKQKNVDIFFPFELLDHRFLCKHYFRCNCRNVPNLRWLPVKLVQGLTEAVHKTTALKIIRTAASGNKFQKSATSPHSTQNCSKKTKLQKCRLHKTAATTQNEHTLSLIRPRLEMEAAQITRHRLQALLQTLHQPSPVQRPLLFLPHTRPHN